MLVFELSMIFCLNSIVHQEGRDTAILIGLFTTAVTTLMFICIAAVFGLIFLKYFECILLKEQ